MKIMTESLELSAFLINFANAKKQKQELFSPTILEYRGAIFLRNNDYMATMQERAELHKTIWKIASKLFQKNGNKNVLLPEHQDKIMALYQNRQDEQYLAKLVKNDAILENDANLSVSSYVEQEDTREVINIAEVNAKLERLVAEGNELNVKIEAIIKELGE